MWKGGTRTDIHSEHGYRVNGEGGHADEKSLVGATDAWHFLAAVFVF